MSVAIDWEETGPGTFTRTLKIDDGMVEAWVKRWNGHRIITPKGLGKIEFCEPDEGSCTVRITVKVKSDL